jgi:hypothetical protein
MAKRFTTAITIGGQRVEHPPADIAQTRAWRKANCVFCPLGPAPTRAWFLMRRKALLELDKDAAHDIVWQHIEASQPDSSDATTTTLTFRGLYLVTAERLYHGGLDDDNALYLVEFADGRYLDSQKSDSGDVRMNLRSYAQQEDFLEGTGNRTWENLVADLWGKCDHLGNFPGLPADIPIDDGPDGTWLLGLNAYGALNAVLEHLDCAIAHDVLAGTYSIAQLGELQNVEDDEPTLQWDGQPVTPAAARIAEKLVVYFYERRRGHGQERDVDLVNNWAATSGVHSIEKTTGIDGSDGTLPLWDPLYAILGENGQLENEPLLDDRADNRVQRYAARMTVADAHRIHAGLRTLWKPGGFIRAVLWRNWGDGGSSPLGGTVTEYVSGPYLVRGLRDQSGPGGSSLFEFDSRPESFLTLDLARHSYPNYPHVAQLVQINHTDGIVGGHSQPPNADGLHLGRVRRFIDGSMAVLDDCWILLVDDFDQRQGQLTAKQGEFFYARLCGVRTSREIPAAQPRQLPLYLAYRGERGEDEIIVFELAQELTIGNEAQATICQLSGGNYIATNATVIVRDAFQTGAGMWAGKVGYRGLARKRSDEKYDILYMQREALFVKFQTTQDRSPQSTAIQGQVVFRFQHGDHGPSIGETITIQDVEKLFPRALKGGFGLAVWNDLVGIYTCLTVQQQCLLATAQVNMPYSGVGAGGMDGEVGVHNVTIKDFTPITPSPFNLVPQPIPRNASNVFGHKGRDNDQVLLAWDEWSVSWIVIDVSKHEVALIFDLRVKPDKTKLQVKAIKAAVETNLDPSQPAPQGVDWTDKIDLKTC